MTKYGVMYHGDSWKEYDSLEKLLEDEYLFKNLYHYAGCYIYKFDELSEDEEKVIDAHSWKVRGWGYFPKPKEVS